jgi:RimJ/RimL family protein N-acetyltransferase
VSCAALSAPGPTIRTVQLTDKAALIDLFERLSARSRFYRFLGPKKVLSPQELENLTDIDHDEREAFALVAPDGRFVAVARYAAVYDDPNTAEVAVTVADEWQGRGIGSALGSLLIVKARRRFRRLRARTLAENYASRKLLRCLGFTVSRVDGGVMSLEMELADPTVCGCSRSPEARRFRSAGGSSGPQRARLATAPPAPSRAGPRARP